MDEKESNDQNKLRTKRPAHEGPSTDQQRQKRAQASSSSLREQDDESYETVKSIDDRKPRAAPSRPQDLEESNRSSRVTYPRPKNFAERLMDVLERHVAPDIIFWYGENDYISVDTRMLKNSSVLDTNFQGIRYAAFARNLSRWGFRKLPNISTPTGVKVYKNNLFQRDRPHLVRHMKIDSDVQEIFGQHERASPPTLPQTSDNINAEDTDSDYPSDHAQSGQTDDRSFELSSGLLRQQLQPGGPGSVAAAAAATLPVSAGQGTIPPPQVVSEGDGSGDILRELIRLSKQYLAISPASPTPVSTSLRSLLLLLIELGTQRIQMHEQQGQQQQQRSSSAAMLQQLLPSLGQNQVWGQQQQIQFAGNVLPLGGLQYESPVNPDSTNRSFWSPSHLPRQPTTSTSDMYAQNMLLGVEDGEIMGPGGATELPQQFLQMLAQHRPQMQSTRTQQLSQQEQQQQQQENQSSNTSPPGEGGCAQQ